MWDFIIDLVIVNETIRYDVVLLFVLAYLCTIWLIVSVWIYTDAKRRYDDSKIALLWSLLVFFLNIPTLMLYLLLRPEDEWMHHGLAYEGGVKVPLVKFTGPDNEVKLAFELKIHPNQIVNSDGLMNIEVDWQGGQEKFQTQETLAPVVTTPAIVKNSRNFQVRNTAAYKTLVDFTKKIKSKTVQVTQPVIKTESIPANANVIADAKVETPVVVKDVVETKNNSKKHKKKKKK